MSKRVTGIVNHSVMVIVLVKAGNQTPTCTSNMGNQSLLEGKQSEIIPAPLGKHNYFSPTNAQQNVNKHYFIHRPTQSYDLYNCQRYSLHNVNSLHGIVPK